MVFYYAWYLSMVFDPFSFLGFFWSFLERVRVNHNNFPTFLHSLEEISTQNGPPKKNNKIIFINFGGRKEKNYFLCSYFRHISLSVYSNFNWESSLDAEFDSASNEYPHCILLTDPAIPKTRNT